MPLINVKCAKYKSKKSLKIFWRHLFLLLLFVLFSAQSVQAARGVPAILSYQGRLLNSSGSLLGTAAGTNYCFKFSIYDSASSGTKLWPSATDPSTATISVKSGVFNANIGDANALDFNFQDNDTVYLNIQVADSSGGSCDGVGDSSFQTLTPRQRIASAAYAISASAVSGAGQSMMGTTTPVSGAVATIEATTTTAVPLAIRGFLNQSADLFRIVTNTGEQLLTFTAGGNLGIGTTSPYAKLSVHANATETNRNLFVVASSTASATTTHFVITNSGKVGIGTSTPSRKLDVSDASSFPQLRLGLVGYPYGEFYVDALGDVRLSSNSGNGGNFRMQDENLWVCAESGCDMEVNPPADEGNIIVETSVFFDNNFRLDASTTNTIMYDTTGNVILEFDEGGGP